MIIFVFFQFFSILAVSMATAAILKKINPYEHNFTWHIKPKKSQSVGQALLQLSWK
jgi:hypothetical protein